MKQRFNPDKTIYLIDGSTFLYRAYYSMRPLLTSKNVPVQAVYVFCRMIRKLINIFDPHKMVLVWDSKGRSERQEIYPEYKAGRQNPPSDIFEQKQLIIQFANLIGLAQVDRQATEADDIIYSLVQDYKNQGYEIVVIASDKDLCQVISNNVFVYDTFKEELLDSNAFEIKMGFPVAKLAFYFSLLGDASDNIPGVKGIGKTTAKDIVNQFEDLNDLYTNIDKISKERVKNALLENKDNAFLSFELFKLRYYLIELPINKISFDLKNWANAKSLFEELEFKSLLAEFEEVKQEHIEQKPFFAEQKGYSFQAITTIEQLQELIKYLEKFNTFAIDTETDGFSLTYNNLVGISICAQKGLAFYIPCGHKNVYPQLSIEQVVHFLKPILEDSKFKKILHNANFDRRVLYKYGIDLKGIEYDTLLAASLVLEDGIRLGLKSLSIHFFQEQMIDFDQIVKNKKLKNFSFTSIEDATKYAAGDAHQTFALKDILEKKLIEENLYKVFHEVEMPISDILFKMEKQGIIIDTQILKNISEKLKIEITQLEQDIFSLSGLKQPINLNSPKQLVELLFEKLKLQPIKKSTKGTNFSTDQSVLEELAEVHIVPKLLIKYRELTKLKSTYVDALPEYIDTKTGRIHTTFSQTITATGRLSSFDPNLQNIPTNSFGVRSAFIPKNGHLFLSADYSQIELRILAYFSQDKNLMDAFLTGQDIHTKTAAYLFEVSNESVTSGQRQIGKRINFSIMYGLTPYGLSKDLKIPVREAKIYIDRFFAQYPGVQNWMEQTIEFVKKNGYVKTYLGRRRFLPGIYEKNRTLYELARRMAINTPAQGTAADLMKLGMIKLTEAFENSNLDAKILIQIHDELLISVAKDQMEKVQAITKNVLESVVDWNLPLIVSTRVGNNWQEITK